MLLYIFVIYMGLFIIMSQQPKLCNMLKTQPTGQDTAASKHLFDFLVKV